MVAAMADCGCTLNNAYMQHSLLALVVIPELRISDLPRLLPRDPADHDQLRQGRQPPVLRPCGSGPGTYATTVTRPDLFRNYLIQQIELLMQNHGVTVQIGPSDTPIPVHFAVAGTPA
jgi:hypothetical protein